MGDYEIVRDALLRATADAESEEFDGLNAALAALEEMRGKLWVTQANLQNMRARRDLLQQRLGQAEQVINHYAAVDNWSRSRENGPIDLWESADGEAWNGPDLAAAFIASPAATLAEEEPTSEALDTAQRDTIRLNWWFSPAAVVDVGAYARGVREQWSPDQWRTWIDEQMARTPASENTRERWKQWRRERRKR